MHDNGCLGLVHWDDPEYRRGMSCDIVHAQRGFRRRTSGDFVNRFTGGETRPMDWDMVELRLTEERNPGVARPAVAVLRQLWLGKRNPTFGRTGARGAAAAIIKNYIKRGRLHSTCGVE